MQIFVKDLNGKQIPYHLKQNITVQQFKEEFGKFIGSDMTNVRLIFGSQELQDHRSMDAYGITPNTTIHSAVRVPGGGLTISQKVKFHIKEETTIEEVMNGIKLLTGYEISDQSLEYQATRTLNGMDFLSKDRNSEEYKLGLKCTMKQLRIVNGSTIWVNGYNSFGHHEHFQT